MNKFWEHKTLSKMSGKEWESLCDGCGKCCLNKIIDDDTEELHFTNVACHLLHTKSCQCRKYDKRFKLVKDCVKVSLDDIEQFHWLPASCAYRRLAEGKPLPEWHPLITGSQSAMHKGGFSVRGKIISENSIDPDNLEDYIAIWPAE
ncbi:YcgN family cysteine cluster protein [Psychromonas sp.]|uniref:YcgN family cysteine cluster protein n=1 Tax=Psychromonas sp. TaxID=1884585 RepID=UPI0035666042